MNGFAAAVILVSLVLSAGLLYLVRVLMPPEENMPHVTVLGMYSPLLTAIRYRRLPNLRRWHELVSAAKSRLTVHWPSLWGVARAGLEVSIVVAWAMWVGRPYLDLNPHVWVGGVDSPGTLLSYFQWRLAPQCGACVLWNGSISGGAPALSELTSGILHPVVVGLILLFDAVNASKLIVVLGLALAGIAQWWLARWMRLGVLPRLWSALLVVTAGHLTARLDAGIVGIVFSTGACALAIPAALELARSGRRRSAVGLAIVAALAILSGQGYLQLALVFGFFPAVAMMLLAARQGQVVIGHGWREFALAGFLSLLLTAVLWVPALHAWPNVVKASDPEFVKAQPLEYIPLNLVIDDVKFQYSDVLLKDPAPATNATYIGWLPVGLAILAIPSLGRAHPRWLAVFLSAILLIYLLASAVLLKWIQPFFPGVSVIRYPPLMTGLLIPLIMGLSAWGVEYLWGLNWPTLTVAAVSGSKLRLGLNWLLLVPLALALKSTYDFGQHWIRTQTVPDGAYRVFRQLRPATTQWVTVPNGALNLAAIAVDEGLRVTGVQRPGMLSKRDYPLPILDVAIGEADSDPELAGVAMVNVVVVDHPENQYAFVDTGQAWIPCEAQAQGGDIEVDCQTAAPGQLVVRENQFPGWQVWSDGQRAVLGSGPWLTTEAPAGQSHFEFRYRPWDVYLGLALSLLGVICAIGLWFRPPRSEVEPGVA